MNKLQERLLKKLYCKYKQQLFIIIIYSYGSHNKNSIHSVKVKHKVTFAFTHSILLFTSVNNSYYIMLLFNVERKRKIIIKTNAHMH